MPGSASRLPARPSLEQLRKQAKDLLKRSIAGDDAASARLRQVIPTLVDPSLGDAQFVLAREYGFDTWSALMAHVDAVNPQGLRRFDILAQEVADAYVSADVERLREINWVYGTSFWWDRDPDTMRRRLPAWFASDTRAAEQALADARQLVAAMSGFQDWIALADSLAPAASSRLGSSSGEPPFYWIDPNSPTIGVRGPLAEQHWDTVISVMRDRGLTGVWAPGASDAAVERFSRVDGVTRLYLGGQITDSGLRCLSRLPGLEELSLGGPGSPVTDRGLEVLGRLPRLARFWMMWAPHVSDAGIANLHGCERLEIVDLMGTHTGDGAIDALAGKPLLRKLATGRLVTDAGAARLNECPRFAAWHGGDVECDLGRFDSEPTHLLLDGPLTGATIPRDLDGLLGLNLFWHTTGLTTAAFEAVAALPRLGFLRLGCDTAVTDDSLLALSRSSTLQHLACGDTPHVTGRGFTALASMPLLRGLAIGCRNVDDESLAMLPRFPSLRSFWPGSLADAGFRHVGRCRGLEAVAFHRETTDAATEHIARLPNLKSFSAGESAITDRSLAMLSGMPSLETVDVHGCRAITDAGVALLASLPHLSALVVHDCPQVTTVGIAALPARVRVRREGGPR